MITLLPGDIIYKENYGNNNSKQRIYVKPPDQTIVAVHEEKETKRITNFFTRVFLPQGYPNSVSRDYTNYQIWDTAQAFCSTITGILATQEVLRGVGVGDNAATPLAATVTWVLKDGCGHLGKIYFAYSQGIYLDAYSKKWRLYADALNDAAMCIEIALPVFKSYTTFILCISTVMKAIVGVAGGATRAAMTQHHAIRSNLADVSAKDSAQETAVNLIASLAALLILTVFGSSLVVFAIMVVLHIVFNYLAVRSVCLKTLNPPRFLQIIEMYLTKDVVAKPCLVNRYEPIITWNIGRSHLDQNLCGFQIRMGHSMKIMVNKKPNAAYINKLKAIYSHNDYIIFPCIQTRKIDVFLRNSATSESILCAYFHSILYSVMICAINKYDLPIYKSPEVASKPFAQLCGTFEKTEWSREPVDNLCGSPILFSYEPSFEAMECMNHIVEKEWMKLKLGLEAVGWDLKKNLLIVEEWRITNSKVCAKQSDMQQVSGGNVATAHLPVWNMNQSPCRTIEENEIQYNNTIEPDVMKDDLSYFSSEEKSTMSSKAWWQ